MKKIAIIGYGVVGGGITEVIDAYRKEIETAIHDTIDVKYILDLRDFPDSPYADRIVHDLQPILADREVALVCETMGGSHPAYEFSVQCMESGKSVVTSNKEVVANYGDQLLACAEANGVRYMFEASVGGGIPCLRPFYTSLSGTVISKICGIVNGTTNYILTKMRDDNRSFDDVLKEAQELGYAERNPSADIDGIDAKRKIIILSALACTSLVPEENVTALTLRDVTKEDIEAARKLDGELKYIATANFGENGQNSLYVAPTIVRHSHPLSHISGVYNGISVSTPLTGDIMYYGRGAGRYPTAGAVLSDVVAILSGAVDAEQIPHFTKNSGGVIPFESLELTWYLRAKTSIDDVREKLAAVCESYEMIDVCETCGQVEAVLNGVSKGVIDRVFPDAKVLPILA